MELLMYTIEWLDVVLPLGNVATCNCYPQELFESN